LGHEKPNVPKTFEQEFSELQTFLSNNGLPARVVWLTPADIVVTNSRTIYVKLPVSPNNELEARRELERSVAPPHGMLFYAVGSNHSTTFAYAWRPKNRDEAVRSLNANGLKFALAVEEKDHRKRFVEVRSEVFWRFLRFRHRAHAKYANDVVRTKLD
jgi:hypothetical protein